VGNEDLFLKSGFHAFLSKPIDIIRLDRLINRYVRDKNLERELSLAGKVPPPDAGQAEREGKPGILAGRCLEGVDFKAGLNRFDGNEEMYLGIVSSCFSRIPPLLEKLRVCTRETLKTDYKITVHSLKSTSYTTGARSIGSMAEELEKAAVLGDLEFVQNRNGALVADLVEWLRREIDKPELEGIGERLTSLNIKTGGE
jgi:HPt (histidine-containing phosphotransfer) domain-containing protein